MNADGNFDLRIAFFTGGGYSATVFGATFVDSRLTSHVLFAPRHYPLGYWLCLVGIPISVCSFLSVRRSTKWRFKVAWPVTWLLLAGALSLLNFRPEFPHIGVSGWLMAYGLVAALASWIRYAPLQPGWLGDERIAASLKQERIKEIVTLWRTIAISLTFGYMALVVPWTSFIWNQANEVVKNPGEVFLLASVTVGGAICISLFVLSCLVYEAFRRASSAADLLLLLDIDQRASALTAQPSSVSLQSAEEQERSLETRRPGGLGMRKG